MSEQSLPGAERAPSLDDAPCPLCGADTLSARGVEMPPYRVVRCTCGLWYLRPRLAETAMVESYRGESYFEGGGDGYSSYRAQEETLRRTFRPLLRTLERRGMTGGKLLEVGCAYGFFLDEARPYYDLRVGTEFSEAAASNARARANRILIGGLEQLGAGERFDTAAVIHVIEHIYDPVAFLETVAEHLEPGGHLVVATPDMGGFWRPLMGRRWPFYKSPEHVTYFDRASLERLLRKAGFVDIEPLPYRSYFSLDLVGEKLGLPFQQLRDWVIRLPATTLALSGRRP